MRGRDSRLLASRHCDHRSPYQPPTPTRPNCSSHFLGPRTKDRHPPTRSHRIHPSCLDFCRRNHSRLVENTSSRLQSSVRLKRQALPSQHRHLASSIGATFNPIVPPGHPHPTPGASRSNGFNTVWEFRAFLPRFYITSLQPPQLESQSNWAMGWLRIEGDFAQWR